MTFVKSSLESQDKMSVFIARVSRRLESVHIYIKIPESTRLETIWRREPGSCLMPIEAEWGSEAAATGKHESIGGFGFILTCINYYLVHIFMHTLAPHILNTPRPQCHILQLLKGHRSVAALIIVQGKHS